MIVRFCCIQFDSFQGICNDDRLFIAHKAVLTVMFQFDAEIWVSL